jgi:DNA/RNA endonuclease YhcR with UshA esterase domain
MGTQKLAFILSLLGILLLIFLSQTKPIQTATVESIHSTNSKTTIQLQDHATELIIFETPNLNLTKGDNIKFQGKEDAYKNKKQIIVKKLSKIK